MGTPLHNYAISPNARGQSELPELLLKHAANLEAVDNNGLTPLLNAVASSSRLLARFKSKYESRFADILAPVSALVLLRADVGAKNSEGQTALELSNSEVVKKILEGRAGS